MERRALMPRARKQPTPPPLYQSRGAYRKADVRVYDGTEPVMIHDTENVLRQLEFLGVLNARQREAGEIFERDYRIAHPSGSRDSLDMTPRGEDHETDERAAAVRRAATRVSQAKRLAGTNYAALRDVAAFRRWVKRAATFMPALLDLIADEVYKLPQMRKPGGRK